MLYFCFSFLINSTLMSLEMKWCQMLMPRQTTKIGKLIKHIFSIKLKSIEKVENYLINKLLRKRRRSDTLFISSFQSYLTPFPLSISLFSLDFPLKTKRTNNFTAGKDVFLFNLKFRCPLVLGIWSQGRKEIVAKEDIKGKIQLTLI